MQQRLSSKSRLAVWALAPIAVTAGACSTDSTQEPTPETSTMTTAANDALTREEGEELQRLLNTTDLAVGISADVESLEVGGDVRYEVTITNLGPNPASRVQLIVSSDPRLTLSNMDQECALAAGGIECSLGEIPARETRTVSLVATLRADPAPDTSVETHVQVENLAGPDPNEANNGAFHHLSAIAN